MPRFSFGALQRVLSRPWVRRVRLAVLIVSWAYLLALLVTGFNQLRQLPWLPYVQGSVVGLLLYPISLVAQAIAWSLVIGLLDRADPGISWRDLKGYTSSHLLRRLPGGVWFLAERAAAYYQAGSGAAVPLAATGVELTLILATAGICVVGLGLAPLADIANVIILPAAVAAAGALAARGVAIASRRLADPRRIDRPLNRTEALRSGLVGVLVAELYLVALVIGGLILYLLVLASGADSFTIARAIQVWAAVAIVGTIVTLLPVGLGIRDVSLVVALAPIVTPASAVVIALLFRLLFVLGDLLWGYLLLLVAQARTRSRARSG